jgi:hypothetical protein
MKLHVLTDIQLGVLSLEQTLRHIGLLDTTHGTLKDTIIDQRYRK